MKKTLLLCMLIAVMLFQTPVVCYASENYGTVAIDKVKEKAEVFLDKAKEIFLDIWVNIGVEESGEDDLFISQHQKSQIFFVIVIVAVVGVILWLIIDFIKMPWKQKGSCLITMIKVIIICSVISYGCYYIAVKM